MGVVRPIYTIITRRFCVKLGCRTPCRVASVGTRWCHAATLRYFVTNPMREPDSQSDDYFIEKGKCSLINAQILIYLFIYIWAAVLCWLYYASRSVFLE